MTRFVSKTLGLAAGVLALTAVACSQEGPTTPAFDDQFAPAFDIINSCTAEAGCFQVEICKAALLPVPLDDPDAMAGGTYSFHYEWNGADAASGDFTIEAITNFPAGCVTGTRALLVPNSATQLVVTEQLKTLSGGYADVWNVTSTPQPGCIVTDDIFGNGTTTAGSATVALNGSNCVNGKIYFKNTFVEDGTGLQGCTPGYWGRPQHLDSWANTVPLLKTTDKVEATFGITIPAGSYAKDWTLLQAVNQKGNGNDIGQMLRHATAALLNASTASVDYPYSVADIKALVQAAILSGQYETTKNLFATANELGCPLN